MSKGRFDPRRAPRHTGDAWERGHQLRPEQNFKIEFGPFTGMRYAFAAGGERQFLARCSDGLIHEGILRPVWAADFDNFAVNSRDFTWRPAIFRIDGGDILIVPGRDDSTGNIRFDQILSGGTTDSDVSTIAVNVTDPFDMTAYGNNVYFVIGSGEVRVYDVSAGTFAAVSGSPTGQTHIWVQDNNLCCSDGTTVYWAVDGDPTDWSSRGSGSNTLDSGFGSLMGVSKTENGFLLVGTRDAVRMLSTGTIPVFRFVDEPMCPAMGVKYEIVHTNGKTFFFDTENVLVAYNGQTYVRVPDPWLRADDDVTTLTYLSRLDLLAAGVAVGTASNDDVLLIDPHTLEIVGEWSAAFSQRYILDHPNRASPKLKTFARHVTPDSDSEISYELVLYDTGGGAVDAPIIDTHTIHLAHNVQIYRVDIIAANLFGAVSLDAPEPTLTVRGQTDVGFAQRNPGSYRMIFDGNFVGDYFSLRMASGDWDYMHWVRQIIVYGIVVSDDDREIL